MRLKNVGVLFIPLILLACGSGNKTLSKSGGSIQGIPQRSSYTEKNNLQNEMSADGLLLTVGTWKKLASMSPRWKKARVDTTSGVVYLSEIERQVIIEINLVRTDPAEYARKFLTPIRAYFRNNLLQYPNETAISTKEGPRAVDKCITALSAAKPQPPLFPKEGLTLAARDHARDQSKTGTTGHSGSDRSTMEERINRYGRWNIAAGENIDYGNKDARRIVTALLIDDGVLSRGHRHNLMDNAFRLVGIALGPHPVFGSMCVMDFAGAYK